MTETRTPLVYATATDGATATGGKVVEWRTRTDGRSESIEAGGEGYAYSRGDELRVCLFTGEQVPDFDRAVYILDNGQSARPYYVAGYHDAVPGMVYLHPFPTNPGGRKRTDNGRSIDYSAWKLAPSRCYHVKIAGM